MRLKILRERCTKNMIANSNVSILDDIQLNKGRVEGYVACGMKSSEILTIFRLSAVEMDKWCIEEYGMSWKDAFELIRQATRGEYLDAVKDLGIKGNPTALSIVDRVINGDNADETSGVVFNVNVKVESENDKQCSEK